MRVLVTGAGGFVGRHLIRELLDHRHEIIAFDTRPKPATHPSIPWRTGDIRQAESVRACVTDGRPDACIHLAAMTFIPTGWSDPDLIFSVNLLGALHVLQAFRASAPAARLLVISSAEVYGHSPRPQPVTENDLFDPTNPYAVAKAAADRMSLLYHREYGLPILVARPCNHIGPGQSADFVVASFARQLADGRQNAGRPLKVGNLDCARDFTDVRDVVRAYRLLLEAGKPGEAYNIASGAETRIRDILTRLCDIAGIHPPVEIDPGKYRSPSRRPLMDIRKIEQAVDWKPQIPLDNTLRDIWEEVAQA